MEARDVNIGDQAEGGFVVVLGCPSKQVAGYKEPILFSSHPAMQCKYKAPNTPSSAKISSGQPRARCMFAAASTIHQRQNQIVQRTAFNFLSRRAVVNITTRTALVYIHGFHGLRRPPVCVQIHRVLHGAAASFDQVMTVSLQSVN